MTTFLAPPWDERAFELHVGVLPVDLLGGVVSPTSSMQVLLEQVPRPHRVPVTDRPDDGLGLPPLRRSRSGRFAVLFGRRGTDHRDRIVVRVVDPARTVVPRRLSVPAPLEGATGPGGAAPARACRPVLFPAPTRGLPAGTTALLGRAVVGQGGPPAAWARVQAGLVGLPAPVWLAHADAEGAFVLVVGELPATTAKALDPLQLRVQVRAAPPGTADPSDSPAGSAADPLWQLPVERIGRLMADDPVESGRRFPSGYSLRVVQAVPCPRGAVTRPRDPFVLS